MHEPKNTSKVVLSKQWVKGRLFKYDTGTLLLKKKYIRYMPYIKSTALNMKINLLKLIKKNTLCPQQKCREKHNSLK